MAEPPVPFTMKEIRELLSRTTGWGAIEGERWGDRGHPVTMVADDLDYLEDAEKAARELLAEVDRLRSLLDEVRPVLACAVADSPWMPNGEPWLTASRRLLGDPRWPR